MFRWYQNAAKCYVFLSDVSTTKQKADSECSELTWESDFRRSRWFTRGWTLQELLAPRAVEFYSREGKLLGEKRSLEQQLHQITGIAVPALQGAPLHEFGIEERLLWIKDRQTKRKEDKAYSLLGIFGIYMLANYGEGEENAFNRLQEEIHKQLNRSIHHQALVQREKEDLECIKSLRITDPNDDKRRIEDTKGGLLADSYRWILDNNDFRQWQHNEQSRLLWIKGDPGKGKTMLLCGIINELQKTKANSDPLSYFFCQAADSRINSAVAVLRGLMYMLVDQQPSLISHIRKKYDHAGKVLFEDTNAWVALCEIFTNILRDPSLKKTYLVIDALDECVTDLPKLLAFVAQHCSMSSCIKWIVTSRNWPDIEERLDQTGHKVKLRLELNAESVSAAVRIFIEWKVSKLAREKKYDKQTRDIVLEHLTSNANDTFLWVALVCQHLEKVPRRNVRAKLALFPPGLDLLYERMMQQIYNSDDADLYKHILASVAIVYRPVTLKELTSLVDMLEDMADDLETLREIISLCGSFLTIRQDTVYWVHQSAKDFLFTKASDKIFPSGTEKTHYIIFLRSLQVLSKTLRRDIYSLRAYGYPAEKVKQPDPDPLAASRYSCVFWVDHLCDWNPNFSTDHSADLLCGSDIDSFLRKRYLYWLEALSLCKSMSKGVVSMEKLKALIQRIAFKHELVELVRDAHRFIMAHKWVIENNPLQAYMSALIFSPTQSPIRQIFEKEVPDWIIAKPYTGDKWSACLQTLEGHSSSVNSVAFSHDSTRLASVSNDRTVKIWDPSSGDCLQTLEGHS
ncbi:NACHT-domain-containing protein, partial [Delitschia confertaspora ATCC 74209]